MVPGEIVVLVCTVSPRLPAQTVFLDALAACGAVRCVNAVTKKERVRRRRPRSKGEERSGRRKRECVRWR